MEAGKSVNWTSVNWTSVNWTSVNWTSVNWTATTRPTADGQQIDLISKDGRKIGVGVHFKPPSGQKSVNWTSVNWTSVNWTSVNWTATTRTIGDRQEVTLTAPDGAQIVLDLELQAAGAAAAPSAKSVNWTSVNWTSVNWTATAKSLADGVGVALKADNGDEVGLDLHLRGGNGGVAQTAEKSVNWTSVNWTSVNWTSVNWTATNKGLSDGQEVTLTDPSGHQVVLGIHFGGKGAAAETPAEKSVNWTSVNWTSVNWTAKQGDTPNGKQITLTNDAGDEITCTLQVKAGGKKATPEADDADEKSVNWTSVNWTGAHQGADSPGLAGVAGKPEEMLQLTDPATGKAITLRLQLPSGWRVKAG